MGKARKYKPFSKEDADAYAGKGGLSNFFPVVPKKKKRGRPAKNAKKRGRPPRNNKSPPTPPPHLRKSPPEIAAANNDGNDGVGPVEEDGEEEEDDDVDNEDAGAPKKKRSRINWGAPPHRAKMETAINDWFQKTGDAVDSNGEAIEDAKIFAGLVDIPYNTLYKYIQPNEVTRRILGNGDRGPPKLLDPGDVQFIGETLARADRCNDGASRKEGTDLVMTAAPNISREQARRQLSRRVIPESPARVRSGFYGRGRQIKAESARGAITAVGQTISLDAGINPTKEEHGTKLMFPVRLVLDGWRKDDGPTEKKLPVEADVPEYLVNLGRQANATSLQKAVGDLALIAFYYLLRIGEYTGKPTRNGTKQTQQFKLRDVTFFKKDRFGRLRQLPRDAPAHLILSADSATLKLDNQKNGWKGVCIHQHANGDCFLCPVRALGRRVLHLRSNGATGATYLSAYWEQGTCRYVTHGHISAGLKLAGLVDIPYKRSANQKKKKEEDSRKELEKNAPAAAIKLETKNRNVDLLSVREIEAILYQVYNVLMQGKSKLRKSDYVKKLEEEMAKNIAKYELFLSSARAASETTAAVASPENDKELADEAIN